MPSATKRSEKGGAPEAPSGVWPRRPILNRPQAAIEVDSLRLRHSAASYAKTPSTAKLKGPFDAIGRGPIEGHTMGDQHLLSASTSRPPWLDAEFTRPALEESRVEPPPIGEVSPECRPGCRWKRLPATRRPASSWSCSSAVCLVWASPVLPGLPRISAVRNGSLSRPHIQSGQVFQPAI